MGDRTKQTLEQTQLHCILRPTTVRHKRFQVRYTSQPSRIVPKGTMANQVVQRDHVCNKSDAHRLSQADVISNRDHLSGMQKKLDTSSSSTYTGYFGMQIPRRRVHGHEVPSMLGRQRPNSTGTHSHCERVQSTRDADTSRHHSRNG